ncbi:MAG: hypothetical protein WCS43_12460 [Verrucomicrobiota bacterium]
MRYIPKHAGTAAEACIQGFIEIQKHACAEGTPWESVKVDYGSFTRTPQLRQFLIEEQKGLCAYTGTALDNRLAQRRPNRMDPPRDDYWFKPHIEHLKPEEYCREELERNGGIVGKDVGEDMAYVNMVAAVEVAGTSSEWFGASLRGTKPLPVWPTRPECEQSFEYLESGRIVGLNDDADVTIANLGLDHATLEEWRRGAIRSFLSKANGMTDAEIAEIARLDGDGDSVFEEFAFVLAPFARSICAKRQAT